MSYVKEATEARLKVLEMIYGAQKSHIGSCFSCIDILAVLFDKISMTADLKPNEDRVIVSKGWIAAAFFYFLARKGVIPEEHLDRFCAPGESEYIGLLEPSVNGVLMAGGSVGMGLSFGVGVAKAKKLMGNEGRVYVLEGDGGMQTGMTWESLAVAAHHCLDNLCLIIDRNGLQAMGEERNILGMDDLYRKLSAFGWECMEIDGHSYESIDRALNMTPKGRPVAIIANTVKCKGIPTLEGKVESHYRPPTEEEYKECKERLCRTLEDLS